MTTTHHLNETALDRELRFIEQHIIQLEIWKAHYEALQNELDEDEPDEDRRHAIYIEMTDLEFQLVLLPAAYERKAKLESL